MSTGERRRAALVMGIDPGTPRDRASASWSVLTLEPTGTIGVQGPAPVMTRPELQAFLRETPLLNDERLRLVALGAPLTPARLERKPLKARLVEIRFARGAFAGAKRGPQPPWISSARTGWLRYQQGAELQDTLQERGFPLYPMPPEGVTPELPRRCCIEVLPKAMLTVLLPRSLLVGRPIASEFMGQIDDWLFPQAFLRRDPDEGEESAPSRAPIEDILEIVAPGLRFAPETLQEAERIASIRRPFSRREPLRAFLGALQGVLALAGAACLIGAEGETEGSYLLPAVWHPDWEEEWARPADPRVRRVKVALSGER
jgi:hypothetical protein